MSLLRVLLGSRLDERVVTAYYQTRPLYLDPCVPRTHTWIEAVEDSGAQPFELRAMCICLCRAHRSCHAIERWRSGY